MTDQDQPDNLVLRMLRAMDVKLDRVIDDMIMLKHRMSLIDERIALMHVDLAGLSVRMDKIEIRLGHVETRLDLREAT